MFKMFKKTALLTAVITLNACAYAMDDSIQDVKFETPGAHNATCEVTIDKLKYKVKPPNTLNLFKSKDGATVKCLAPGNRSKTIHVKSKIEPSTKLNVANAGIGAAWDYASGAMFRYPDLITIDFSDVPVMDQPMPAHNSPDIRQPEEYTLEEFSPSAPRMNADGDAQPIEARRRSTGTSKPTTRTDNSGTFTNGSTANSKGTPTKSTQTYGPSRQSNAAPTSLYPGD